MASKQGTTLMVGEESTTATLGGIGGLSRANHARLKNAYPTDPKYTASTLQDTGAKDSSSPLIANYIAVARGTITGNPDFGTVDLTFNTADNQLGDKGPNAAGVAETGAGGLPANAYVPNTASPGQGNGTNPAALPAPPNTEMGPSSTPFEGEGSQLGVAESSTAQAGAATTLGSYGLGKSPYSQA